MSLVDVFNPVNLVQNAIPNPFSTIENIAQDFMDPVSALFTTIVKGMQRAGMISMILLALFYLNDEFRDTTLQLLDRLPLSGASLRIGV